MCLILFAVKSHPLYKLAAAANRDEFYKRPTAPADWWKEAPFLLAGRDLQGGGAWLGVSRDGKIAAVTNFRSKEAQRENALSRGLLVRDYLLGEIRHDEFIKQLQEHGSKYNGFNLVFGTVDNLYYFSNRAEHKREGNNFTARLDPLPPGIYGMSNAFLDTPWPKVVKGKKMLNEQVLNRDEFSVEKVFSVLADTEVFPDDSLPDTGIGIIYERILSPLFIKTGGYGTRSATVILVDNANRVTFIERSFVPARENYYRFGITDRNSNYQGGSHDEKSPGSAGGRQ
jgi:uncharacterized protein with NRDE domain